MADRGELTNKQAYEARDASGQIYGAIGPCDWDRFRQTLKFIPPDTESLLDAGCDRGHWLNYVHAHRRLVKHLGVDLSEARIEEARKTYPHLVVRAGHLEALAGEPASYDVVTCLEVLEHVPNWLDVLGTLLRIAKRRVVATVPYKERIVQTICVHCGELTPLYGHLRTYDESSFPAQGGWRLSLGYIMGHGIGMRLITRVYRIFRPRRGWLVACYDREGAARGR